MTTPSLTPTPSSVNFNPYKMKQSSIEWLMEIDKSRAITIEEWQQAKAMHKEEIINSYNHAYEEGWDSNAWQPEQYYKETFNNEEK